MSSTPSDVQISLNEEKGYVLAVFSGVHDEHSLGEAVGQIRKLSIKNKGVHALYDLSGAEVVAEVNNAYFFPRKMQKEYLHLPTNKIAVVKSKNKGSKFWSFYETTARNAGLELRPFDNFEGAERWLLE